MDTAKRIFRAGHCLAFALLALCVLSVSGGLYAGTWNAIDWIDGETQTTTPEWQQKLGINWVRVSCQVTSRLDPQQCINFIKANPTPGTAKYFIYLSPNSATILANALKFSALTAQVPEIESVGVDDFFNAYGTWSSQMANAPQFVSTMIDNLKNSNRGLKFGITLYEDELDPRNAPIDDAHLPAAVKAKFDYIHLFLHYRKNASHMADYVRQAQQYFPNAQIIAGVYSMDRVDYIACAQGDSSQAPCTESEETSLYEEALKTEVNLMQSGQVAALEFFPGYFGGQIPYGPGNSYYVAQQSGDNESCNDLARCLRVSATMRDMALSLYQNWKVTVSTSSPPPTPEFVGPRELSTLGTLEIKPVQATDPIVFHLLFSPASASASASAGVAASAPSLAPQPASVAGSQDIAVSIAGFDVPLGHLQLVPGRYRVRITAENRYGLSHQAEEFITLTTTDNLGSALPFPNPWRSDKHPDPTVTFGHLTLGSIVKIFALDGHHVRSLMKSDNQASWDLKNDQGDRVASGLYIYLITNDAGQMTRGKLAIIR